MNTTSEIETAGGHHVPILERRLFFAHVGTVVLTAIVVVALLLTVTVVPIWLSVGCCAAVAVVAIAFFALAIRSFRENRGVCYSTRILGLVLTLALCTVQASFVLPVLICVYAPTFRS